MFNHLKLDPLPSLQQINGDGSRYYMTEDGLKYPSITTILSKADPNKGHILTNWRKKIGYENAKAITANSALRGTILDGMVENHLNNEIVESDNDEATKMFGDLLPFVNQIDNIHFLQPRLHSNRLCIAGTADIIGEFNNKLAVIDIKNARKTRTEEQIWTYYLQVTAYACCYNQLTSYRIKNGVIMMAVEDRATQIFEFKIFDYIAPLIDVIRSYHGHPRGS